tara:strand:+ start:304 stop:1749 length:1446 start_codon:yes stop_codon:yes gene_type:complete
MAGVLVAAGASLNIVPQAARNATPTNYVDFTTAATAGWAQQYLPDLMEGEVERYGKRTISGFLSQVGAEEPSQSDRVVWSEQGRLHLSYTGTFNALGVFTIAGGATHSLRIGQTVLLSDNAAVVTPCYVSAVATTRLTATLLPYDAATVGAVAGITVGAGSIFVYGSEFGKGADGLGLAATDQTTSIEPQFTSFDNKMIIIKETYRVSGSDVTNIGWIEVSGENGETGYYWYLKSAGECMSRFADYCEMTCIEGHETAGASTIENALGLAAATVAGAAGTRGLFESIRQFGNTSTGVAAGIAATLNDFDQILQAFDAEGAIEENMIWCNRAVSLNIDDMLSQMTGGGLGGTTSFGVFQNDENMALNLGFTGFRRGSYDFYKADWKYLNDGALRAGLGFSDVRGVFIPAGASNVYDEMLGRNMKRPFLHVRYRANDVENRKMKTWFTDSVGAATSSLDVMTVNHLSERCLITQGANNFLMLI